jgi:Aldo/keto reductase family
MSASSAACAVWCRGSAPQRAGRAGHRERRDQPVRLGEAERMSGGLGAAEIGATPAQLALAWLLAQRGDISPIPGTRRSPRVEEDVGADAIELSAGQLNRLNDVEPPVGDRYADMTPTMAAVMKPYASAPPWNDRSARTGSETENS